MKEPKDLRDDEDAGALRGLFAAAKSDVLTRDEVARTKAALAAKGLFVATGAPPGSSASKSVELGRRIMAGAKAKLLLPLVVAAAVGGGAMMTSRQSRAPLPPAAPLIANRVPDSPPAPSTVAVEALPSVEQSADTLSRAAPPPR